MLQVRNLRKTFVTPEGPVQVIDGVSFTADEGSCYVLLGPSGCGKTTTLRCIAGLEQAESGSISIAGIVVSDAERGIYVPVHKRPIGMVFQSYAIWPHMNVFDNVAYPLRSVRPVPPKAELQERVMQVLRLVSMDALASRPSSRLSGGQQQRVALARALVRKPALLLLDEPLSNLDARLRESMRNELSDMIAQVGVTALFVTHDQAEAFALGDRLAVMHRGRILQEGQPRETYSRPRDSFVAAFLGAANLLPGVVRSTAVQGRARVGLSGVTSTRSGNDVCEIILAVEGHVVGDHVEIVVRPEDVDVFAQCPDDLRNVVRGTLRKLTYLGGSVDGELDLGGTSMRISVPARMALQEGQVVWIRIDEERCTVLAASPAPGGSG